MLADRPLHVPELTSQRAASIFKRLSEPAQPRYQSTANLTSNYQRWNVMRKLPVPLGRHPRTIAIDGD